MMKFAIHPVHFRPGLRLGMACHRFAKTPEVLDERALVVRGCQPGGERFEEQPHRVHLNNICLRKIDYARRTVRHPFYQPFALEADKRFPQGYAADAQFARQFPFHETFTRLQFPAVNHRLEALVSLFGKHISIPRTAGEFLALAGGIPNSDSEGCQSRCPEQKRRIRLQPRSIVVYQNMKPVFRTWTSRSRLFRACFVRAHEKAFTPYPTARRNGQGADGKKYRWREFLFS